MHAVPNLAARIADYYNDHDAELPLPVLNEHETLVASLQTYLTAMDALGVQTWITQSTLVGWNLDQQIPAEDTAVYVQMTESSMKFLANYYNMTLYHYGIRDPARSSEDAMGVVRNYMLEVMAQDTTSENAAEDVRAKWINLDTGLFVSISTLQGSNPRRGRPKALAEYTVEDIFPLHDVVMEKTRCYVPYKYASND